MDRRQYLGLTGASITALLGGCTGDGNTNGERIDEEATPDNATISSSPTPTERGSDNATVEEETTTSSGSTEDLIERSVIEILENSLDVENPSTVENNVDKPLVDRDNRKRAEDILTQTGDVPYLSIDDSFRDAYRIAMAAQYIAHEIYEEPIDPDLSQSIQVRPIPVFLNTGLAAGVDLHDEYGRTTMIPDGDTSRGRILYTGESAGTSGEREIRSLTELEVSEDNPDSVLRIEHYDAWKSLVNHDAPSRQTKVNFRGALTRLVPGLNPDGLTPGYPPAAITEPGHQMLQRRTMDNYEGIDPYLELTRGFSEVKKGNMGVIDAREGELVVEDEGEPTYDSFWVELD